MGLVVNFEVCIPSTVAVAAQFAKLNAVNTVFALATEHLVTWQFWDFVTKTAREMRAAMLKKAATQSTAKAVYSFCAAYIQLYLSNEVLYIRFLGRPPTPGADIILIAETQAATREIAALLVTCRWLA